MISALNRAIYGIAEYFTIKRLRLNAALFIVYPFYPGSRMDPSAFTKLDTDTALIFDSVYLFALALDELSRIQDISIDRIDCKGSASWAHGSSLINYMKMTEFEGISGKVQFDMQGLRSEFQLEILELQETGLEPIGEYLKYSLTHLVT